MAVQTEIVLNEGGPQPYHLVKPSPWPILGALAGFITAVGGVIEMHDHEPWLLIGGFVCVLLVMAGWWRDVIHEAVIERAHSAIVKIGLRYGMALFIASEVMFFVAFFWAFFSSSLFPSDAIKNTWPPPGIKPLDPFHFPLLMTMILLLSGTTVTWAHHEIIEGHDTPVIQGLLATVLLGMSFTAIQAFEYSHAAFAFNGGIFPSVFFMATGFHGFHVIVGTIFLVICLGRAAKHQFTPRSHFGFEAAAWYWHFVDVVWLFLFVSIYLWGGYGAGSHPGPSSPVMPAP
jgi:cytochrome c oxidase subunit 3